MPRVTNENVLIGYETADDAGVYRIDSERALVQTVDFFTPIVDDPFTFGAIAAANSLSDVWAMGGRPLSALSLVAFPAKGDLEVLGDILRGGASKMQEAGCVILGGHSVSSDEVMFGYSVTGMVHPGRVWPNSGARVGDRLVFTKRLGTGVVSTALKRGIAREEDVAAATESMLALNREAAEALEGLKVHGCTDVSGFGFLGHAREMAIGSGVTIEVEAAALEWLPGAEEYARQGAIPGGLNNNRDFVGVDVEIAGAVAAEHLTLLYDPQTSGGLLISLPERDAAVFLDRYPGGYLVGRVKEPGTSKVRIV